VAKARSLVTKALADIGEKQHLWNLLYFWNLPRFFSRQIKSW